MHALLRHEVAPARERFDHWREPTAGTFTRIDETDAEHFEIAVRTWELGALSLSSMTFRPRRVLARPVPLRLCQGELPPMGGRQPTRTGRTTELPAGGLVLSDGARPLHAVVTSVHRAVDLVRLQFPEGLLPLAADSAHRLAGRTLSCRTGIGTHLADFLVHLADGTGRPCPADAVRLGKVVLELLAGVVDHALREGGPPSTRSPRHALMVRVQDFIERHLGDAGLSPGTVAAAHHISVSHLYRLFRDQDLTVAEWIRKRRLENCRRELADRGSGGHPIHVIAARWGFADNAHFSRTFRAAYGLPPSDYRRLVTSIPPGRQTTADKDRQQADKNGQRLPTIRLPS
ncbi:helix-turn-helix domain-containing protein [Actinosynnema sp. NPDC020468]|uniref:helix-turn-helix domain-containing protein n=1 Tax=Actinosynnema sp. NPDC020468 TaxID=3154488 RepID=UPI00340B2749